MKTGFTTKKLHLENMDCSDCAMVIQHRLERLDGVGEVSTDYFAQTVNVEYDPRRIRMRTIKSRIHQLGYSLVPDKSASFYKENWELILSLLGGLILLITWLSVQQGWVSQQASILLYLIALFLTGFDVLRETIDSLQRRHIDIDLLMILASLGAIFLGKYVEGVLLLFLFGLGHALQERALNKARKAINSMGEFMPKYAYVRRKENEVLLPVDQITFDDLVLVRPGDRIPVDGEVVVGFSSVDQSPVTGESLPITKIPGEPVYAGSVNGDGVLEVKVTRLARDSTLARVMKMVEQAQSSQAPTHLAVEKFTKILVPFVLSVVLLLTIIPPLFGEPFSESFIRAITVLVAASPCALALGTPSAILSGIARAARDGVLIKGGVHLENLGQIRAIAFDKTGTLTLGKPLVTEVIPLGDLDSNQVLGVAAALEELSGHPLAQAVKYEAESKKIKKPEITMIMARPGRGVQAMLGEQHVWLGNIEMTKDDGSEVSGKTLKLIQDLEDQGKTTVLIGKDKDVIGLIALADKIRPGAGQAIRALQQLGVQHTIILSGDNHHAAKHIADQLDIDIVRAKLMPEDKLQEIEELINKYQMVGMVGDGVNDAPALARASVGIAAGSAGNSVALETSDVALMASDLSKLPFAVGLGRATRSIILQNLFFSVAVMILLSAFAIVSLSGIGLVVLIHESSTLVVVLNALRLLAYRVS